VLYTATGHPTVIADRLPHLPPRKHRVLTRALQILFEEFENFQKNKTSESAKRGRIVRVILYGSHARGDWVEDRKSGYFSDYDLLVVVNTESLVDEDDIWDSVRDRLVQTDLMKSFVHSTVNVIVHSHHDVNDQLARGRPFFVDIDRDGIALFEATGYPLAKPGLLTPEERNAEAWLHFDTWFTDGQYWLTRAKQSIADDRLRFAAFDLHQFVEGLYHCTLLVLTLYSPQLHALRELRRRAEDLDRRLVDAWPRRTRTLRKPFNLLHDAYVKARYSRHYAITREELDWLVRQAEILERIVATICAERLGPRPPPGSPEG
jgi:predicted nucleotidyltransferase/HEPN domain-containing protein